MMGDKGSVFEARFSVIVTGSELPTEELTNYLALQPTRILRKGDRISAKVNVLAGHDEWIYTVDVHNADGADGEILRVLKHLREHKAGLTAARRVGELKVVLHVQSDYAQMFFNIAPETMAILLELNMPLAISALSWGEVF